MGKMKAQMQAALDKPSVLLDLPPGWSQCVDTASGKPMYWRTDDPGRKTQWKKPTLPAEWEEFVDPKTGKVFYYNKKTDTESDTKPTGLTYPQVVGEAAYDVVKEAAAKLGKAVAWVGGLWRTSTPKKLKGGYGEPAHLQDTKNNADASKIVTDIDGLTLDRRRCLSKFQSAPLADTTPRTHYSSGRDGHPEPNQFGAEGAWHGRRLAERLRHYEDHYSSGAEGHPPKDPSNSA